LVESRGWIVIEVFQRGNWLPQRFERVLYVGPASASGRLEITETALKHVKLLTVLFEPLRVRALGDTLTQSRDTSAQVHLRGLGPRLAWRPPTRIQEDSLEEELHGGNF
jgi:hypothetical protein